jgi:putative ABC transport system permease protein
VLSSLLISPLPVADSEHVVTITGLDSNGGPVRLSLPDALDLKQRLRTADAFAVYRNINGNLGSNDSGQQPAMVHVLEIDSDLFKVMGVRMAQGRAFQADANQPGHACEAVISWKLWKSEFGGAPLAGRMVRLNEKPCQVDGVLPEKLDLPMDAAVWVPKAFDLSKPANRRQLHSLFAIAHLKSHATVAAFNAELASLATELARENPSDAGLRLHAVLFRDSLAGNVKPSLLILLAAVGLLLLLACANVANLLLARSSARLHEMSVRVAVGASRESLIQQVLTESLALALASSVSGLLLCALALLWIRRLPPLVLPRPEDVTVDWRVMTFALLTACVTALLFGALPALRISLKSVTGILSQAGGRITAGRRQQLVQKTLVSAETAMATLLLIGSLLLLRSFYEVSKIDVGFNARHLLSAYVSLNAARYGRDTNDSARFARNVIERLKDKPGIEAATFTTSLPLESSSGWGPIQVEGRPTPVNASIGGGADPPAVLNTGISPAYRRTMKIPLLAGVDLEEQDDRDDGTAVLVNAAFARVFFRNESPIGKRIRYSPAVNPDAPWQQIVGVIADTPQDDPSGVVQPEMYRPLSRTISMYPAIIIRTKDNPLSHVRDIEAAVRAVDPELPLFLPRTMEQVQARRLGLRTFFTTLLTAFASLALLLAGGGIFAVIAYSVSQRTSEIGVRMACGATRSDVLRLIVLEAMVPALAGVVVGLGAALVLSRYLAGLLYGVQAIDFSSYASSALILVIISVLAALWPAWRAARLAPWRALRYE